MMMRRNAQRGVVLIVALVVMASMTLAAIALVRAVDSGILIAANLAFRQSATLAAEGGLRNATNFLIAISTDTPEDLYADGAAYWANAQNAAPAFDPLTYNWEVNKSVCVPANCAADAAGNVTRYVVHRLCDLAGNPLTVNCIRASQSGGTVGKSVVDYRRLYPTENAGGVYYRITVRVTGPRNTNSYVQSMLY